VLDPDRKYIECWQTFAALEVRDWPPASFKEVQSPDWLFEHELYRSFVERIEFGNLELRGQTGSGLSFIASFLSTSLRRDMPNAIILQYSFDSRDSRQCSTFAMFASLTCQLLSLTPHCFVYVRHLFNLITDELSWSLENLWAFFRAMALCPAHGTTIVCIIDAVNKCDRQHDHFLDDLILLSGSGLQLKTITTNSGAARNGIALPTIDIDEQSGLRSGIEEFVVQKLEKLVQNNPSFLVFGDRLQKDILHMKPSFLTAALTCKMLENAQVRSVPSTLERELTHLPRSLPEIYDRCFLHVEGEAQVWAYDALFWIAHACRPLTTTELAVALAIKYNGSACIVEERDMPRDLTRDLIHVFRGFVRIQSDDVLLIHESAKDFLLEALHVSYPQGKSFALLGHSRLVNFCLDYLLSIDWLGVPSAIFENETQVSLTGGLGLLLYAIEYWPRHYRLSSKVSSLAEKANKLLEKKECTKFWSQLQWYQKGKASKKQTFSTDPLTFAAKFGLNDIVLSRLESPSCTDADRATVLHLAALRGDVDFVEQLLSMDFKIKDALHLATKRGHGNIVKRIIEFGANIGARDDSESIALHYASQSGYQSIVIPLIEAKSDVNAIDINGSRPIHLAAEFGHVDVMETLIAAGAEVGPKDCKGSTPLHLATRAAQLDAMKLLMNNQEDIYAVDNDSKTALHLAAASGLLEPLDLLLSRHVWVDVTDGNRNTALHLAVGAGQLKIVQRLLDEEPDVEIANDTGTPLHLAAQEGHIEIMTCLLDAKADPMARNSEERIPLHLAASRGHTRTIQQLIEIQKFLEATGGGNNVKSSDGYGVENTDTLAQTFIDTQDAGGATPLHLAAASGSQATIQALIKAGASVNTFDYSGYSPLMRAVRKGDLDGVKLIFNAGAEVDSAILAVFPIHVAAEYSNVAMIQFLLESGANPEMPDLNENKPLHAAAKAGNIEGVQELLDCGVDVDPFNDDGATPLHLAAAGSHFEVVQMLVEAGHDTNVSDQRSSTPLHAAARVGDLRTLDFLIERAANIRAIDNKKQLPIHIAAEEGHTEIVKRLLQHRSKVYQLKVVDSTGQTAIHIAARMDFPEIVRILLDEGGTLDTTDSDRLTALHLAVQKSHISTVRLLLEKGASLEGKSSEGSTVLHFASEYGSTEIVKLLLNKGAAIHLEALDSSERTPLFLAIYSRNLETVKCLLDAGGNINASPKWPAMYTAAYYGRTSIVEELLSRGFDREIWEACGNNNWTPLHGGYDTAPVLKLLLDAGANVNAVNSDGKTALHLASYEEITASVKLLVEHNADLSIADQNGSTALHEAVDKAEIVEVLLDKGTEVDVLNNEGQTPLFRAVNRGGVESFEMLLKHGADLWTTDKDGSTPLHAACSNGSRRLVEAILEKKDCRLEFKDNRGCTPFWCAVQNGHTEVVEMLLPQPGVNVNQQNNEGKTLLLMATERISEHGVEIMKLLLKAGDEIDASGEQLLRVLAGGGHVSLVKILLEKNVNPDATDEHGWTAAMMATAMDKPEVLEILPGIKWSPSLPTSFSSTDKSEFMILEDDDMCVKVSTEDSIGEYCPSLFFLATYLPEMTHYRVLHSCKSSNFALQSYLLF
jgi:serine/threonine-protein phosphatase 6 regulatory ankyrin repeat subunit B